VKKPGRQAIERVLEQSREGLLKKANVVGVGIGEKTTGGLPVGRLCLKVYVEKKLEKSRLAKSDLVPLKLSQVETDVEEVGKIKAHGFIGRMRPALGGVSIGHYKITAGTLGCLVRDKQTGRGLILSNNHVLANSNAAKKGDIIIQPGAADGGKVPKDKLAELERWIEIDFKDVGNLVDCALAAPVSEEVVKPEIASIGLPRGVSQAQPKMMVQKSGRTTGHTFGEIKDVSATMRISYGRKAALFRNQILTTAMSQGGDSGSLVLDQKKRAVGLLFAGSDRVTLCNPIQEVLRLLGVTLSGERRRERIRRY
jgi:S1-C subfamily serine protease